MDANPPPYLQNNFIPFFFTAVVFSTSVATRTPSILHLVAIFSSSNYLFVSLLKQQHIWAPSKPPDDCISSICSLNLLSSLVVVFIYYSYSINCIWQIYALSYSCTQANLFIAQQVHRFHCARATLLWKRECIWILRFDFFSYRLVSSSYRDFIRNSPLILCLIGLTFGEQWGIRTVAGGELVTW